jgi:hypothetical protein
MTNHLAHLSDSLDSVCKKLDIHEDKLNKVTERIAKIEGKLE